MRATNVHNHHHHHHYPSGNCGDNKRKKKIRMNSNLFGFFFQNRNCLHASKPNFQTKQINM